MHGKPRERGHRRHGGPARLAPLAVLALGLVAFFAFGLDRYVSLEALRQHRHGLADYVHHHALAAALAYIGVYCVAVATSVPGGAVLTVAGGFLFGPVLGTVYAVAGATVGATLLFLAARHAGAGALRAKVGGFVARMEDGFRRHALNYLLFLRLVPLFPFWLVNLVPAFLNVPLSTYVIGTFVGVIPATLVFALVGDGIAAVVETGGEADLGIILQPRFLLPLVGLGLLALVPVVYNKARRHRR
ncbi:MAG: TVP38/TMEM64 family protein [Rhodospirillales bacterium]